MTTKRTRRATAGFSLVEMLVVVAIIAVLVALIVGYAGYANRKAARAKAITELGKLENAIEEYRALFGTYPQYNGEVKAGTAFMTTMSRATNRAPGVLAPVFEIANKTDPWGRYYNYTSAGSYQYKLWSKGEDDKTDADDLRVGAASL